MMMFYRRRASPKLRDDMTEVVNCGGGHRTRLRQLILCVLGCPQPPYIKEERGRPADPCRARQERGVLLGLQVLVGFHLVEGGRRKGEGEEKGGRASSPSPIRTPHGGCAPPPRDLPSLSPKAHVGPLLPRGVPVTPRYSINIRNILKPFRCPSTIVQYIDLYVSTISRLLVMSPISSGTPNSFGTSKLINS